MLIKCFDQLWVARSTQKLVEIHNILRLCLLPYALPCDMPYLPDVVRPTLPTLAKGIVGEFELERLANFPM